MDRQTFFSNNRTPEVVGFFVPAINQRDTKVFVNKSCFFCLFHYDISLLAINCT